MVGCLHSRRRCRGAAAGVVLRYSSDAARRGRGPRTDVDAGRYALVDPIGAALGWRGPGRRRRVRLAHRSSPSGPAVLVSARNRPTGARSRPGVPPPLGVPRRGGPSSRPRPGPLTPRRWPSTISACSRLAASRRWAMRFRVSDWRVVAVPIAACRSTKTWLPLARATAAWKVASSRTHCDGSVVECIRSISRRRSCRCSDVRRDAASPAAGTSTWGRASNRSWLEYSPTVSVAGTSVGDHEGPAAGSGPGQAQRFAGSQRLPDDRAADPVTAGQGGLRGQSCAHRELAAFDGAAQVGEHRLGCGHPSELWLVRLSSCQTSSWRQGSRLRRRVGRAESWFAGEGGMTGITDC